MKKLTSDHFTAKLFDTKEQAKGFAKKKKGYCPTVTRVRGGKLAVVYAKRKLK